MILHRSIIIGLISDQFKTESRGFHTISASLLMCSYVLYYNINFIGALSTYTTSNFIIIFLLLLCVIEGILGGR